MRAIELEAWVRRIIDGVRAGANQEDSRVELKAVWPDDVNKAARRIAGHLNASSGEPVLWVIGVNETGQLNSAVGVDPAAWWAGVKSQFDGQAASVQDLVVDVDGVSVAALLFDSDLAPYVVRNPKYGQPDGGPIEREVPWREGTAVRSATRTELLRMLLPAEVAPTIEVLDATAHLYPHGDDCDWGVEVKVYATLPFGSAVVLPDHMATGALTVASAQYDVVLATSLMAKSWSSSGFPRLGGGGAAPDQRVHTVHQGDKQVILEGPGFFRVYGSSPAGIRPDSTNALFAPLLVSFRLPVVGSSTPVAFTVDLTPDAREPEEGRHPPALIRWRKT